MQLVLENNQNIRRVEKTESKTDFLQHDGFFVDYKEFGHMTKDVLKNAHVIRDKSPCSPAQIRTPRLNDLSQNNSL